MVLLYSIISVIIVSLLAFIGIIGLVLKNEILKKVLIFFVSLSAGSLIGGAFFHLIPEAIEKFSDSITVFVFVLVGFCLFFVLERILRWHHCHDEHCEVHSHLGWMNLVGDGFHNLLDGMIIYSAFLMGPALGVPVIISIIIHEVPQEIGDFGVLIYSGFSRIKAIFYNFISALASLIGVFIAYFLCCGNNSVENWILPLAAGGFIYIAASDLVPELHKEKQLLNSIFSFIIFILALVFMWAIKILSEG